MVEEVKEQSQVLETVKEPSRTLELVLGIMGGFFGLLGGIGAVMIGSFGEAFNVAGYSDIMISGTIAIIVSITGVIGAVMVKNKPQTGGIIMILSAIIGFICIFVFYILGGFFLALGGVLALVRK
ncbi:MAG: DUF4064 domain-containing protein [Methanobacterium sp.]|jgi:hypothetical protein